ncbi:MAG: vanadium-dependent haloperoxidase [Acidobacteriaceae bacterium]|nr:vanadium-dependent haloperoxidase [Acidobacteriaceae bacterium]
MQYLRISLLSAVALLTSARASAQNVVTDWNTIASTTIVSNAGQPIAASGVYFAYASIAVYDAVNAVHHHKFQPFYYSGHAPGGASDEAAAVAAAHRVLVNYFPAQQTNLDAQFNNSLSAIVADSRAKAEGVDAGEAAAAALISERAGDGLNANVPYTPGSGPGVWQPTTPGFLPAATPWLGQMRPFTMRSAGQFLPGGPTSLTSEEWVADYNVTRLFGDVNSTLRTPAQSEIGLFWTAHTGQQYSRTFNSLVQHYNLDIMDSARLLATLWTGFADGAIGCFNGKYTYSFWRPVTAVRAGGDNPELTADANWTPLATTPNHPEYPAAHACISGTVTNLVADFFGTRKVHVVVDSTVFNDGVHTHTFENTEDWLNEIYWARIFAGFHFNHSLQDGEALGRQVASQLFANHFGLEHGPK